MSPLVVVLIVGIAGALVALAIAKRRAPRAVPLLPDLQPRMAAATAAFARSQPWVPATAAGTPEAAAAIEAALIAGEPAKALAVAEAAVAVAPDAAASRVWLGWALCANGEPTAALAAIDLARQLDRDPGRELSGGPLAIYVEARARHLAFEHGCGELGATPPLVTKGDVAIVTLAGSRGGAAWVSGEHDIGISHAELAGAVAEHRAATSGALALALDALAAAPGFADAAYLAARLAIKGGSVAAGRALFAAIAGRITGRPDADAFARDLDALDHPQAAVAAALEPPPPPTPATAKRSRSLKVL